MIEYTLENAHNIVVKKKNNCHHLSKYETNINDLNKFRQLAKNYLDVDKLTQINPIFTFKNRLATLSKVIHGLKEYDSQKKTIDEIKYPSFPNLYDSISTYSKSKYALLKQLFIVTEGIKLSFCKHLQVKNFISLCKYIDLFQFSIISQNYDVSQKLLNRIQKQNI